jgi:phosphatidylserine/phosphatidylglycerophosphate/cardiolipin synthase-like enzyme
MLIDDVWATVGSSNLHRFSLFGNGELNAAISAPEAVRGFKGWHSPSTPRRMAAHPRFERVAF